MINNSINTREILNSLGKLKAETIGLDPTIVIDNDTLVKTIEENLHLVISVNPDNDSYKNIFYNYPYIVKICFTIFIEKWSDTAIEHTAEDLLVNELNVLPFAQITTSKFFIDIHNFMLILAESYSTKMLFKIEICSINFLEMIRFYEENYKKYKEALIVNLTKYEFACDVGEKGKKMIEASNEKINSLEPSKKEVEKDIGELKDKIGTSNIARNNLIQEIKDFDNPISNSKLSLNHVNDQIKTEMSSYVERVQITSSILSKIEKAEIVDFRNLIDNHAPSKFLLSQVFAMLGENSEYDYVKKNMDPGKLKSLIGLDYTAQNPNFVKLISDTVNSPDFLPVENFSKVYTISIKLNEWFNAMSKYNKARNDFRNLYKKVKDVEKKLEKQESELAKKKKELEVLTEDISKIEKELLELEKNKNKIQLSISKQIEMNQITTNFIELTNEKLPLWTSKKAEYESALKNFEFYLIFLSAFVAYAGHFNATYRKKIKNFFKSKVDDLSISNSKKIDFIQIAMEMINLKKDKDLLNSINVYDDIIKENFLIMHYNKRIPFVIDHYRVSKSIICEYFDRKDPRMIIVTKSKDSDFMEQIDKAMTNGYYLIIEQADDKTYNLFKNVIKGLKVFDKGRACYVLDYVPKEFSEKFKILFIKDKMDDKISNKFWLETQMINFDPSKEQIKVSLSKNLIMKEDFLLYNNMGQNSLDILKDQIRLQDSEERIHNIYSQFDFSGNTDRNNANQSSNDKMRIEFQTYTIINENFTGYLNKKRENEDAAYKYEHLSKDCANIWKLISRFIYLDNVYNFSFPVFVKTMIGFYITEYEFYY